MKVLLILSLALVFLASVSFAAPSRVILPANAHVDLNKRGKEVYNSFLEWRRSLPAYGDRSFRAYENLIRQRELSAEQAGGLETPLIDERQQESQVEESESNPVPYGEDGVPIDDGEPQQIVPLVSAFGFPTSKLQGLYQQWLPNVPAGEDSSFQAFLQWMREQEETVETEEPKNTDETDQVSRLARWSRKIEDWTANNDKRIFLVDEQAEGHQSTDEEQPQINPLLAAAAYPYEEQPQINLLREATGYEDAGVAGDGFEREIQVEREMQAEREMQEEREMQVEREIQAERELQAEREIQEAIASAYDGRNEVAGESQLADMERRESEELGGLAPVQYREAESQEGPRPVQYDAEAVVQNDPSSEYQAESQEEPEPFEESEPNDTNGGYSCEENSPCNIENIANEQFYFATASADKFIQCDVWGGCHTLTCDDGLVWIDRIKTCGPST